MALFMGPQRKLPMHRRIQTAPPEANILTTVSTSSASFFLPMEVICRERRKVRHEVYCFLLSINTSLRLVLIFFFFISSVSYTTILPSSMFTLYVLYDTYVCYDHYVCMTVTPCYAMLRNINVMLLHC